MNPLTTAHVSACADTFPTPLVAALRSFGDRAVVAGGLVRAIVAGEKVSDIDVWVSSKDDAFGVVASIQRHYECSFDPLEVRQALEVHESANSLTIRGLGVPVQVIHRWTYSSVLNLLNSFDYTIAQGAVWWDRDNNAWASLCSTLFYEDVEQKVLHYLEPVREEARAGSLMRLFKFYKRGYSVSLETLAAVMARAVHGPSADAQDAADILKGLKEAGRRLPAPPKPPDLSIEEDLAPISVGSGIGGSSQW